MPMRYHTVFTDKFRRHVMIGKLHKEHTAVGIVSYGYFVTKILYHMQIQNATDANHFVVYKL